MRCGQNNIKFAESIPPEGFPLILILQFQVAE